MNQPPFSPPPPPFPPQGGFPPPQGGFPPQQGGFPPPQGGFPPPQGGFPPQPGYGPGPGGPFPPYGAPPGNSNKTLFIGLGIAGAVVVLVLILWLTGVFGGGSKWIEGRWCDAQGSSITFSNGSFTTSQGQTLTYTLNGSTLTLTGPGGVETWTVTQPDSNTLSLSSPQKGTQQARRC
jgi:hypothetical protein